MDSTDFFFNLFFLFQLLSLLSYKIFNLELALQPLEVASLPRSLTHAGMLERFGFLGISGL